MMTSVRRNTAISVAAFVALTALALSLDAEQAYASFIAGKVRGPHSVSDRLGQYAPAVASRLRSTFARAGLAYPPNELAYVSFKDTRVMEVYGRMSSTEPWRFVREYRVLAASGRPGPKLAQGDGQVPEGLYQVENLNPNSLFHLSIRLNYPNEFDRRMAQVEGRTRLGGDIMIHGNSVSTGCLAVGDQAAEDLFVLTALVSKERVRILISPTDFRRSSDAQLVEEPSWVQSLYATLRTELFQFRREANQVRAGF